MWKVEKSREGEGNSSVLKFLETEKKCRDLMLKHIYDCFREKFLCVHDQVSCNILSRNAEDWAGHSILCDTAAPG